MKLETEFYKLPVTFDPDRVYGELSRIEPFRWVPQGSPRYLSLPLVSHHGLDTNHPSPPTWPTSNLARCPYLRQVLAYFRSPLTDVRVRRAEPGTSSPAHYDGHYAAFSRYRLHLPLVTDSRILFRCNGRQVHMDRGEVWLFDRLSLYGISNPTQRPRVHITIETGGSSALWNLIERSARPFDARRTVNADPDRIEYQSKWEASVLTENTPGAPVLSPGEVEAYLTDLLERLRASTVRDPKGRDEVVRAIHRFSHDWRTLWSLAGADDEAWPRYRNLASSLLAEVSRLEARMAGGVCDLKPGLHTRLQDFLTTGAFNPRMSAYSIDGAARPDRIYELLGEPLMRLGPDGTFEFWNPVGEEYLPVSAQEIDLLRWFATPSSVADAAEAAGYACDEAMLGRVVWFVQQHILRPLRALPGLPLADVAGSTTELSPPVDGARVSVDAIGAMAPARSAGRPSTPPPGEHFPLRLQDGIYFRLTARSADVHVWVPKLNAFRSLNWYWLRLTAALATGKSVRQASEMAGLMYDAQVEAAVSMLLDHGVLVGAAGLVPRRLHAGGA
jgi:Aspartyl/Asparaginyl beta-hydroxylase